MFQSGRKIILLFFLLPLINTPAQQQVQYSVTGITDSSDNINKKYIRLTIYNPPKLTFQLNFDYDFGVFELSANDNGDLHADEFAGGQNFGVRHGFGAGLTVKIPLHESGKFRLNTSFMYNGFSSKFNKVFADQEEFDFVKYNVFSGSVGIENNFTPSHKVKAYIGFGLLGSFISGSAKITQKDITDNLTINPAFRMGLTVYSGLEYMLTNTLGFNFGLKVTHANLWLKKSSVSETPGEIYLNDQRVTTKMAYSGFRQFAWGSLSTGLNYYFGIEEKHYYYKRY